MTDMTKMELYQEAQTKLYEAIASELRDPSVTYLQVAVKYGVGHTTVCHVAKLYGITRARGRKPKAAADVSEQR
jgi:hypothetical protein